MEDNEYRPRSTFVSVIAWIFIVLSGFGVFIGILQNVLFAFLFSQENAREMFEQAGHEGMPVYATFIFENFQLIIFITLLLMILLLASSIGLLLRKDWARRIFIGYMFLTALYMVVGSFFHYGMMNEMLQPLDEQNMASSSFMELFRAMQYSMMAFNIIIGLVFGWIGWKLMGADVREEFGASA